MIGFLLAQGSDNMDGTVKCWSSMIGDAYMNEDFSIRELFCLDFLVYFNFNVFVLEVQHSLEAGHQLVWL